MRGKSENDERSGAGGRPGQAAGEGEDRGQRSAGPAGVEKEGQGQKARGEEEGRDRPGGPEEEGRRAAEEGRRSTAARPEDGEVADIRDVALGVDVRDLRRTDHGAREALLRRTPSRRSSAWPHSDRTRTAGAVAISRWVLFFLCTRR